MLAVFTQHKINQDELSDVICDKQFKCQKKKKKKKKNYLTIKYGSANSEVNMIFFGTDQINIKYFTNTNTNTIV